MSEIVVFSGCGMVTKARSWTWGTCDLHPFSWLTVALIVAGLQAASAAQSLGQTTVQVVVPGWSDPWLAGMPDGSTASCCFGQCDEVPEQSPADVLGLCLDPGDFLTFETTGGVARDPEYPIRPPDGDAEITMHIFGGAENGISDIEAPFECLVGLFLDETQPNLTPAPPPLYFGDPDSRDYLVISPLLKQVFFIGDGLTSQGDVQQVIIPNGATRFYLGTMDGCGYYNNIGAFDVLVTELCEPTPSPRMTWGVIKRGFRESD